MLTKLEAARESTKADEDKAIVTSDLDLGVAYCVLPALSCCVPQSGSELTESPQFFYFSRVQGYGKARTKKKKRRNQELVPLPPLPQPRGGGIEDKTSLPANDSKFEV